MRVVPVSIVEYVRDVGVQRTVGAVARYSLEGVVPGRGDAPVGGGKRLHVAKIAEDQRLGRLKRRHIRMRRDAGAPLIVFAVDVLDRNLGVGWSNAPGYKGGTRGQHSVMRAE